MTPLRSDARLARRAAAGDERAFATIFKRYHQDLYRFCLAIVGRAEDAQDALQNTMVKALRSLPGEEREVQLKPWLYRVAHNESVDLLRRRREGPELDAIEPGVTADLSEMVERRRRLAQLLVDLETLPERQRAGLVMRELGGLGYEQIAEALGSSGPVARQTVYEARLNLRELEAGREMDCELVTRQISEADGRVTRRRDIQAHLRSCPDCRAFREAIPSRRTDLTALAPLPAVAAGSILQGLLGSGHAGAGLGAAGAGVGKAVTASAVVKSAATVAAVAAIGVTAADRGGLIHTEPPGGRAEPNRDSGDGGKPGASSSSSGRERGTSTSGNSAARSPQGRAGSISGQNSTTGASNDDGSGKSAGRQETAVTAPANEAARGNLPAASNHGQQTAASHGGGRAAAEAKSQAGRANGKPPPTAQPGGDTPSSPPAAGNNKRPENPPNQGNPPDDTPAQPLQPPKAKQSEPGPPDGPAGH